MSGDRERTKELLMLAVEACEVREMHLSVWETGDLEGNQGWSATARHGRFVQRKHSAFAATLADALLAPITEFGVVEEAQ